jgi:hypothetical protein
MTPRTVFTTADEQDNHKEGNDGESNDAEDLHPAWCAGGRSAVGAFGGDVRIPGLISHQFVLLYRALGSRGEFYKTVCLQKFNVSR